MQLLAQRTMLSSKVRSNLGYHEHAGTISLARHSAVDLPAIDWPKILKEQRTPLYSLTPLNTLTFYSIHCYAIDGRLKQHTDCVAEMEMTSGIIIHGQNDLHLNSGGSVLPASAGDQFLLDPLIDHGAETEGLLIFAAHDEDVEHLPTAPEARKMFLTALQEIANDYPRKS
tara:strand:- start:3 stop:515 length:513 start_codon:yes stop_codon:yes gene_type:complete